MAFTTPSELQYSKSHEWVLLEGNQATIGISDYAQDSLGDIVYVDLPSVDSEYATHDIFGAVESVKAASDLFIPVAGRIIAVNEDLISAPELINTDPYGKGWMIKVELSGDREELLSAADYEAFVDEIKH